MREKKWSKGPWQIGAIESGRFAVDDRDGEEVTGWIEEHNANLIAAAPDLVEALENLVDVVYGVGGTKPDAHNMARASLAKAYGETNHD